MASSSAAMHCGVPSHLMKAGRQYAPVIPSVGRTEGVFAAPEAGALVPALEQLVADGFVKPDDHVVLFGTGAGMKYIECF